MRFHLRHTPTHLFFATGPYTLGFHAPFQAPILGLEGLHTFHCAQQYISAGCALIHDRQDLLDAVMKTRRQDHAPWNDVPHRCQALTAHLPVEVSDVKSLALTAQTHLFSQHDALRESLALSEERVLVYACEYDRLWGVGLSLHDDAILNPTAWKGSNLSGATLMKVRDTLCKP